MKLTKIFQKYLTFNDLILIGALIVGGALAWNTVTAMQRNYRLQQKFNRLQAEVDLQKIENQNLRYQIAYLKTDAFLELAAREKFNKAAPGETMVYLPGSGEAQRQAVASQKEVKKVVVKTGWRGNVEAWLEFLKGKSSPDSN